MIDVVVQAVIDGNWSILGTGVDFSFLSAAGWDLGTSAGRDNLFFDDVVYGPDIVAEDCVAFAAALESARAARGNASAAEDDAEGGDTVLDSLLGTACVPGSLQAAVSVSDINQRLLCANFDVRPPATHARARRPRGRTRGPTPEPGLGGTRPDPTRHSPPGVRLCTASAPLQPRRRMLAVSPR